MRRDLTSKKHCGFKRYLSLAAAALCCFVFLIPRPCLSFDAGGAGNTKRVVVVDPGHGGNDEGAKSPEGRPEKQVSLTLAKKFKEKLEDRYRVVLTRTADYGVSPSQRASIANNREGGLFISLHAGGGFRRLTDLWSIYFFRASGEEKRAFADKADRRGAIPWHRVQLRHAGSSALLAEKLKSRLSRSPIGVRTESIEAPLAVLKGLDMPAVVVEYGYITHPKTAAALADESYLDTLAGVLAAGVSDFFASVSSDE
ncbi:MAG: N-acetylmuramoyl-L-alanine amidase [Desulfobacteraceae bacterium]|nr:N-acetylmuramoyl-L-alanine amidase [Desulfobacteraceae bacterium]